MAKKIVPSEFKTHLVNQIVESIVEPANTSYYAFVGDHIENGTTDQDISQPGESNRDLNVETYRKMIFGKRIGGNDMRVMIRRYDWTPDTVYTMYDDTDDDIYSKNFYVVVDETSYYHVYKCLYNADGAASTVQPVFADTRYDVDLFEAGDGYYQTSDGYQWKYMYSIPSVIYNQFTTQNHVPVVANTDIESTAVNGSIDVIRVIESGRNYNNYISGQFASGDLRVGGNTIKYKIPDTAAVARGFYSNTIIYLSGGTGAGQYKRVTDSELVSNIGVVVTIDSSFSIAPDTSTKFEITPEIDIVSDGTQTVNAVARAIIDPNTSNSVTRVEMLDVGRDYNFATASVKTGVPAGSDGTTPADVGNLIIPTAASIRPIIPPPGGHGANTISELGGSALGIYTKLTESENFTVSAENTFAQFGIIRDPVFANVEIDFVKVSDFNSTGSDGTFVKDETFYQIKKLKLHSNVSLTISNTIIEANQSDAEFNQYLEAGDFVYITDDALNLHFISTIKSTDDANTITLNSEAPWTSTNSSINLVKIITEGKVKDIASTSKIYASSVDGVLRKDEMIIGTTSYAVANVSAIDVNNRIGTPDADFNFQTFNQMTRCVGTVISTNFTNDEIVYQGAAGTPDARARVHSANSTHVSLTEVEGNINEAVDLIGSSSGAILQAPFDKYTGDIDPTSGAIIYLQNDVPVSRGSNKSEEIRVILEF